MLYLGGGGSEVDEARSWDLVFQSGQRITVWSFAQPSNRIRRVMDWVSSALSQRGHFYIQLGDRGPRFGLEQADVLVIPGGNTLSLLQWVQQNGFFTAVASFLKGGGKVYGGSAGAILLGADIAICDVKNGGLDENEYTLEDTQGLDLLNGAVVFPHFDAGSSAHFVTCQKWADDHSVIVSAIPEKCGVEVDETGIFRNAGPDSVHLFRHRRDAASLISGEDWYIDGRVTAVD
ncbi:uncharacterized protein JN550_011146 [Neoarthrinium moseri]|uniref:uncharacterized protein n=1 Tax=Neoarthrinium moseri TaxID=1658444 RepID=UPI001FDB851F|nr:uncharacterized protein JN550_011146 [Neoarthrinium moseri]KAI1860991.1 hypothetical protein JN550_011146 [Neoarthrinium moseri]